MSYSSEFFPKELLQKPISERLQYFKDRQIDHAIQRNTFNRAITSLCCAAGAQVMVITGPTGVGKTTLARRLYRELQLRHLSDATADRSMVPVIGVNAAPPTGTSFNWKDFFARVLDRNGDILLNKKITMRGQGDMFSDVILQPEEGSSADVLRRSLEKCIKLRKTRYLIIDEAHHILMVKEPDRLEYQFEMLKSLTIEADITIVLIGTYDLLDIRDYSGQLVRRSEILPMGRYDPNLVEGRMEFASTMEALLLRMPLKTKPELANHMEYFFTKSAGCIGILKDWLIRVYAHALEMGLDTFDQAFADRFALDNKGLRTIIEEAINGEIKMTDEPYENISKLLLEGHGSSNRSPAAITPQQKMSSQKSTRVGTRRPKRDPVGDQHA